MIDCPLCDGRGHIDKEKAERIKLWDETIPHWNQDDHRRRVMDKPADSYEAYTPFKLPGGWHYWTDNDTLKGPYETEALAKEHSKREEASYDPVLDDLQAFNSYGD